MMMLAYAGKEENDAKGSTSPEEAMDMEEEEGQQSPTDFPHLKRPDLKGLWFFFGQGYS